MSVPLCGKYVSGIWWSWKFLLKELQFRHQLGHEAEDIMAQLMGAVVAKRPEKHGDDYVVVLQLGQLYSEHRNWRPPDTLAVPVRLDFVEDMGRHCWVAKTLMFTRKSQCDVNRGAAQSAESHFRGRIIRRVYVKGR